MKVLDLWLGSIALIVLIICSIPLSAQDEVSAYAKLDGLIKALSENDEADADICDSLRMRAPEITDVHERAVHLYALSLCYGFDDLMTKLQYLTEAESLVDTTHKIAIDILVDLGVLYDELELPDKAIDQALRSYRVAETFDEPLLQIRPIMRIVSAASPIGQDSLVVHYSNLGIEMMNRHQSEIDLGWLFGMRGFGHLRLGETDQAIEDFLTGLNYGKKFAEPDEIRRCYEGLALGNFSLGRIERGKEYARLARLASDLFCEHCGQLANEFLRTDDYKMASEYQRAYIKFFSEKDLAYNRYNIASKLLNDNFANEKEALEQKILFQRRTNIQNILITAISAIALFLIFLSFYQRRRNRIRSKMLEEQVAQQTEEIRAQKDKLEQLDQFKTKLYTNITHEFRTPLTVISGLAANLRAEGVGTERDLILRNSNQLLDLVNQMLDLQKLESGTMQNKMLQYDVVQFLRYLTESFKSLADQKGIKMHFLTMSEEYFMDLDPEKITRIYTNLLSNAIKFTPKGEHIYVQLFDHEKNDERIFNFQVRDTGVGISAEHLANIFDRFYQVDDSITRKSEGTGIGLTLVKELVNVLHGSIDVKSTMGQGTTFSVALPVTQLAPEASDQEVAPSALQAAIPVPIDLPEHTDELSEKPLALIIEDNIDVIYYISQCLRDTYQLQIALHGEEGVEKAIEYTPDIVVSDVMMPHKDGLQVCEELKADQRTSHIPIVLLTARADVASRLDGLKRGADAYLSKPFNKEELLATMENQIQQRNRLHHYFAARTLAGNLASGIDLADTVPEMDIRVEDEFLQKIQLLVEKDLTNTQLGMLDLVRGLGMSRSQIYKKVKALTGWSPSVFIRKLRLKHSMELLRDPDLNVSEVAYAVGFDSPSYFSDVFLREFGRRPSEVSKDLPK